MSACGSQGLPRSGSDDSITVVPDVRAAPPGVAHGSSSCAGAAARNVPDLPVAGTAGAAKS